MKITIIIPVYNVEKYIKKTIESLIKQTLVDKEILIINDGSTDNTLQVVREYINKYKYIKIINQKNLGVSHSRNVGINEAKGKYILFNDGDDWIKDEDYLERIYNISLKNNLDVLTSGFNIYYNSQNIKKVEFDNFFNEVGILNGKEYLRYSLEKNSTNYSICTCLIKRELILKNNLYFSEKIKNAEDQEFLIKLFLISKRVKFSNLYSYNYRQVDTSTTKKYSLDRVLDLFLVKENILEYIENNELENETEYWKNFFKVYFYPGILSLTSQLNQFEQKKIIKKIKEKNELKKVNLKFFPTKEEKIKIILAKSNLKILFCFLKIIRKIRRRRF